MLRVVHVYDLMATICHKIRLLNKRTQAMIYRAYWANPKLACQDIESTFGFLSRYSKGGEFLYNSLSISEIDEILDKIEIWSNTNSDNKMLVYLLGYLDRYILFEESVESFIQTLPCETPKVYRFECLNENDVDCWGKLLPRFDPAWAKGSKRPPSALREDPISVMQHYLWVEDTGEWEINNVYSPQWNCNTGTAYTVVCSPVTNLPTFNYKNVPGEDCCYFKITNYHEDDQQLILNRFRKTLAIANTKQANIVLFPEIIASRDCQQRSQKIVQSLWDYRFPRILCLPSSEFEDDGTMKNQTLVLNDSGHEILRYNKQQAFQLEKYEEEESKEGTGLKQILKFFEPITPDYKLTIIHVKGLGRIGIIICADIFNDELCDILLKKYEIRLLLIMAFTAGYDQFFRNISPAQKTSCDVIWCNSCAAYTAFNKTGPAVAYFSYGHKALIPNLVPHCCPGDSTLCKGCVVTITIDPSYSGPGTISSEALE